MFSLSLSPLLPSEDAMCPLAFFSFLHSSSLRASFSLTHFGSHRNDQHRPPQQSTRNPIVLEGVETAGPSSPTAKTPAVGSEEAGGRCHVFTALKHCPPTIFTSSTQCQTVQLSLFFNLVSFFFDESGQKFGTFSHANEALNLDSRKMRSNFELSIQNSWFRWKMLHDGNVSKIVF